MLREVEWPSCLGDAVWMMQLALPHIILFSRDQFVRLQLQSTASFRQARALIRSMSHLKPPGSEAKAANSKATARLLSCWRAAAGLHLHSHMTSEMLEARKKKKVPNLEKLCLCPALCYNLPDRQAGNAYIKGES